MLREENRRLREQFNALREAVLQDEAEGTFPHRTSQVLNPASAPRGDFRNIEAKTAMAKANSEGVSIQDSKLDPAEERGEIQ